jgi:hypothetical protein
VKVRNSMLLNQHREALAFVAVDLGRAETIDDGRRLAQSMPWRCSTLREPHARAVYVQVRGFDPREGPRRRSCARSART